MPARVAAMRRAMLVPAEWLCPGERGACAPRVRSLGCFTHTAGGCTLLVTLLALGRKVARGDDHQAAGIDVPSQCRDEVFRREGGDPRLLVGVVGHRAAGEQRVAEQRG